MTIRRMGSRRALVGATAATLSVILAAVGLSACSSDSSSSNSSATSTTAASNDPKDIAVDAFTYGYPLVLMDATRASAAAANHFDHADTLPTPADRQVVRLNLDTFYSQAWLDVKNEPMIVQVPEMDPNRYWLMQFLDAWSNTAQDPSSVDPQLRSGAKTGPFTYAITGPGWKGTLPDDVTPLAMPTDTTWLLGRVQVNGPDDVEKVKAVQSQMKLVPLSQWVSGNHDNPPPAAPSDKSINPSQQVARMDGPTFFDKLNELMVANPPAAADASAMERFAAIGVTPGGTADKVSADVLNLGAAAGKKAIAAYVNPQIKVEDGWQFATNVGTYGTDYPLRANIALQGLGANLAKDAVYPTVFSTADDNGTPVRYTLHFPDGQLPPARAFWSITAYDADSFLIDNPAGIYAVGHQIPVVKNADGSVDITVQNADPGTAVPAGNWLPIPASGKFSLTLRLYAPDQKVLDGTWKPPNLRKVA
ncbi:MAG: hypothetical protein JWN03_2342 [Nocardia sp.]|uniref:DUF1254 domain-containing protein n=1 Tax=Nocardia sp. TaxID=1821 RepID=UPI0026261EFB|nr:DUF1254 domain-containing protein [Nocardia sp.]MCU1642067.1 hypothetical protein [Nocardia sp.]